MPYAFSSEEQRKAFFAKLGKRHKKRLARALGVTAQDLVNLQRFRYSADPFDVIQGDEAAYHRRTGMQAGNLFGVTTKGTKKKVKKAIQAHIRGRNPIELGGMEDLTVWVRRGKVKEPETLTYAMGQRVQKTGGKLIGHGKGRGRTIGRRHDDPRFTARHEIGHTLWYYLPSETRSDLTARLRHRSHPYEPYHLRAEERFANLYARTRGGTRRRRRGSSTERQILAEALGAMRKKRQQRANAAR
jgi:hypothetical protein